MITRGGRREFEIRKSRFICSIDRANSENDARAFVDSIQKEFRDASHNCVAWSIGENGRFQRSNDDGEPAGTAGAPMLEILRKRGISDTVVVVTRYFGGIMLGAPGPIRAYGQSVTQAIDAIGIVERRALPRVTVRIGHNDAGQFEHSIRTANYRLVDVAYDGTGVTFSVILNAGSVGRFDDWVVEQPNGMAAAAVGNDVFIEVPFEGGHQ